MRTIGFLLGKNPQEYTTGDTTISSTVVKLAEMSYTVKQAALTEREDLQGLHSGILGIPKRSLNKLGVAADSVRSLRSPVHARFDTREGRHWATTTDYDAYVAEHSYMAEPLISAKIPIEKRFVNTHVAESDVFRSSESWVKRAVAEAIFRDEIRVSKSCHRVVCLDDNEAIRYRTFGVQSAEYLPVTLPPGTRSNVLDSEPRMVFLGDQSWLPNRLALERLETLWPKIVARAPGAQLTIVGKSASGHRPWTFDPASVWQPGFVENLDTVLNSSRAMVAPITIGGGVRVKILEAAARGLPVISTSQGIGALKSLLGIAAYDDEDEFIEASVQMLNDPAFANRVSEELYQRNAQLWADGIAAKAVETWLKP